METIVPAHIATKLFSLTARVTDLEEQIKQRDIRIQQLERKAKAHLDTIEHQRKRIKELRQTF